MKPIQVLLVTLMLAGVAWGQNVTVDPGAGSYATLEAAFTAINNGVHTGFITNSWCKNGFC